MIYAQIKTIHLQYKFNMKSLQFFNENGELIIKNCPHQTGIIQIHKYAIESLQLTYNLTTDVNLKSNISIEVHNPLMQELEQLLSEMSCNAIKNISNEIIQLNKKYEEIIHLNQASFYDIISEETLKNDTKMAMKEMGTNYVLPFDYHRWFSIHFWKYVEMKHKFENRTLYIEFDIPMFTKNEVTMFELFSKPIIYDNNAYILNTATRYFIPYLPFLFFNKENVNQYCRTEINSVFCLQDKRSDNVCDKRYIEYNLVNQKFYSECFRQLPYQNIITQIGKKIYFTLFSPIELIVTQNGFTFPIRIYQSSKILENIDYGINSTFFTFLPEDGEKYEIFMENINQNFELSFCPQNKFKTVFLYMLFLLVVNIVILKYKVWKVKFSTSLETILLK